MSLEGKVALITGGGRGIGLGCSVALAETGADIAMTYRKNAEAGAESVKIIEGLGRKAIAVKCDQSQEDEVIAASKQILEEMGRIDILICNAGIASRGNSVRDTTTKEMRLVLDTHVMGSFWFCRETLDAIRERGEGHIILISSVATTSFGARGAPYAMAKVAMEAMAKTLMKEEGPNGIRVNIIGPGLVQTEMGSRLVAARNNADITKLGATFPFGRVAQPYDIGNVAAFLCSPQGSYVNGQTIYVDGGGFQNMKIAAD